MTLPAIPDSWVQSLAAVGGILVVVLILRWTAKVLEGQGKQSATLIDRAFDIADQVVTHGVRLHADDAEDETKETP